MGQRLAPSLAIAFMSKVEAPVMDLRSLLYSKLVEETQQHIVNVVSSLVPQMSKSLQPSRVEK
ncbi:hypothetical protein KIN20_028542 [Parelaphostrongylus tenuis]|uniref:Uncharacterized protein n=1 Tax=Parelaphostrongylus tenuis TaxID=148309 RepID=A0AAD5R1A1_PARTN|nr:hypothetical protein KIN20_028542 [Parelaphostrongylus tenuis]